MSRVDTVETDFDTFLILYRSRKIPHNTVDFLGACTVASNDSPRVAGVARIEECR